MLLVFFWGGGGGECLVYWLIESCFLFAAPAPSNVQSVLATKCLDRGRDKTKFFYTRPKGGCERIENLHEQGPGGGRTDITDKNVVFAFQVCLVRILWFKCWVQSATL